MGERADDAVVTLRGVTKRFDQLVAVDRLDLDVSNGEFLALLGPSGCGKTTTLRMIAGFEEPTEGEITIDGAPVVGVPPNRRQVNTVFQAYALFPHMTVLDNVAYGLKQRGMGKRDRHIKAAEALSLVHLEGRETSRPNQLSGGQQQRVALARALVLEPKVLLLDEPLAGLSQQERQQVRDVLAKVPRDVTIVMIEHDMDSALAFAERITLLHYGEVIVEGTRAEVVADPRTKEVYLGE
jgi:spermidine/putrescine transport system ATP-binding protein